MIQLKDFVHETLVQLTDGMLSAREEGVVIDTDVMTRTRIVEFDIGLTSTEEQKTKAGFGIFVVPFGGGINQDTKSENENVSRVKFSVGVDLLQTIKKHEHDLNKSKADEARKAIKESASPSS